MYQNRKEPDNLGSGDEAVGKLVSKVRKGRVIENGASEGIRTLDTHVGNVMLYQAELRSRSI